MDRKMTELTTGVPDRLAFYDVALLAIRKWYIAALCVGASIGVALWIALTSVPVYRAEAVLALAEIGDQGESSIPGQLGGLAALAGVSIRGANDRKTEALATMESRMLTDSFVRDRNLLPILFASRWDAVRNTWKAGVKVPTLWDANKLIDDDVRRVLEDRKTGLVTLSMEWKDPKLAAEWVTDLVERTNKALQQSAYERANRNIAFLKRQLEETNVIEVRQALNKLLESELKNSMLAQRSEDYAFKVLDPPVVPEEKAWPRRALILALGLTVGIFIWAIALTLSEIGSHLLAEHRRASTGMR
jgi:uncharacterized protein involved in exopolysaccharide biosynthesis